jgi:hypothetical protein
MHKRQKLIFAATVVPGLYTHPRPKCRGSSSTIRSLDSSLDIICLTFDLPLTCNSPSHTVSTTRNHNESTHTTILFYRSDKLLPLAIWAIIHTCPACKHVRNICLSTYHNRRYDVWARSTKIITAGPCSNIAISFELHETAFTAFLT